MSNPTHAPLSQLTIDDKVNARRAGRGAEPVFAASIESVGIILPLVVRLGPKGKGFLVTDGSKRFDSLHFLKDAGKTAKGVPIDDNFQVPITVKQEDDAEARETSLMANLHVPLHPVDEYRAFVTFYHDLRNGKQSHDDAVGTIARHFGTGKKHVEQQLALGNLSDKVLDAWVADHLDEDAAQAFTLCPDKKSQETLLAKLIKQLDAGSMLDAGDVKNGLKIAHGNPGRLLNAIGIEAYEKRGGKVTRDLFGADHVVSDEKLAKAMSIEAISNRCDALCAEGWAWALPVDDIQNRYTFGKVESKAKATPEETAKLAELRAITDDYNGDDDAMDAAQEEIDRLDGEIAARGFTADQKAKAGCFVAINAAGNFTIEYGRVKPEEKKAAAAQERAAEKKKKAKKAAKTGEPEEPKEISGALAERLSKQLTQAAAEAIKADPALALTFAITALQANGGYDNGEAIRIKNTGMLARESDEEPDFVDAYKRVGKMKQAEQLKLLAAIVGTAFDFTVTHASQSPLLQEDSIEQFVCNEIDGKALNKALRATFDAPGYFDAVSKAHCLAAITEAVNADEARKVAGKPKGEIAAFCVANVPGKGWLPPELRTRHYDGPQAKAAPKKKAKR